MKSYNFGVRIGLGKSMRSFSYKILFSLFLATLFLGESQASLRCNGGIIDEGDLSLEVLRKCGPPADRQSIAPSLDSYGRIIKGAATIENWVYGPNNGMYQYLRFIDGKLVEIKSKK